jgi:type I restriction enzyme, S subunit
MIGIRLWIFVKWGDISQIVNGSTPNTNIDEYWNGDIIWVTPKDLGRLKNKEIHTSERKITTKGYNSANLTIIPPNCIVLSTRAPIGYIAITKNKLCFNQGCKGIVPNENVFTDFLYYYLFFIRKSLEILGSGSTFKELSLTNLLKVDVLLPPLEEQKRIVKIIETKLTALKKVKTASDEQLDNCNQLKDKSYEKVFERYQNELVTIDSICNDISDGTHFTPTYITNGIPFLSVKDLTKGYISFDDCRHIDIEEHKKLIKRCNPQYGDVLYTKVGTTGIAKAIDIKRDFSIFVSVALLKLKDNISPSFIEKSLNLSFCRKQAYKLTQGATNKNLVIKDLKTIKLFCPEYSEQLKIVKKLENIDNTLNKLNVSIDERATYINALASSILRKAFNGDY